MNDSWHVVRTVAGREHAVALLLAKKGISTFCPMQTLVSLVRGRLREQYRALFLTYVFANWHTDDPHQWHNVMETSDVIEILGGGEPKCIEPGLVESWIARADDQGIIVDLVKTLADLRRGYTVDDEVRLLRGVYTARTGVVVWVNDAAQQTGVKISILGGSAVIVRGTAECELAAPAPGSTLRRRDHKKGGRRSRRARVEAFSKYWDKHLPRS